MTPGHIAAAAFFTLALAAAVVMLALMWRDIRRESEPEPYPPEDELREIRERLEADARIRSIRARFESECG